MSKSAAVPHVLFVDDSEVMREVWPLLLRQLGFDVEVAEGGVTALDLARLRTPDIIVTDMMMPGMTGIDLYHVLRADSALMAVPVLFLTSGMFPPDRPQKDSWLGKDVAPEDLAKRIRSLLG